MKRSGARRQPAVEVAAVASLTVLEVTAMLTGHDGTFLGVIIMIISGLGGYHLGKSLLTGTGGG